MKKSEMYRQAQAAVFAYDLLSTDEKLDIVRELMSAEDLEIFCEQREAEEA